MLHTANQRAVRWLSQRNSGKMRLFCFSCAGGTVEIFRRWAHLLPPDIELCGIELPGRGSRWAEPLRTDIQSLMDSFMPELMLWLDKPMSLLGHSLGALVSFETARQLRREGFEEIIDLFIASFRGPNTHSCNQRVTILPDPQIIEWLRHLKGVPEKIMCNPSLMTTILPILRADLGIVETYEYTPGLPFNWPISVFAGISDPTIRRQDLGAWREHTSATFSLQMFPGGHFFLHSGEQKFLNVLSEMLIGSCERAKALSTHRKAYVSKLGSHCRDK
jgi:medium-chain acyl-[acyl-carrier-protein] hydrolase